jgi:hypothetical protein
LMERSKVFLCCNSERLSLCCCKMLTKAFCEEQCRTIICPAPAYHGAKCLRDLIDPATRLKGKFHSFDKGALFIILICQLTFLLIGTRELLLRRITDLEIRARRRIASRQIQPAAGPLLIADGVL